MKIYRVDFSTVYKRELNYTIVLYKIVTTCNFYVYDIMCITMNNMNKVVRDDRR